MIMNSEGKITFKTLDLLGFTNASQNDWTIGNIIGISPKLLVQVTLQEKGMMIQSLYHHFF